MARTPSRPKKRPGRVLSIFLIVVVAAYALIATIDFTQSAKADSAWQPRLGLDLQGGTRITLQASAERGDVTATKLREARDIIDQRVNATGVSEAEVSTQGDNQIIIEIPGERRGNIVDQVGRTAQLRFRLVWVPSLQSSAEKPDEAAIKKATATISKLDWTKLSLDQMIQGELNGPQSLPDTYAEGVQALQTIASNFQCTPEGFSVDDIADQPLVTCDPSTGEVLILSPTVIDGAQVKSASQGYDSQRAQWLVQLALRGEGSDVFDTITDQLTPTQGRFAIVLDGSVLSAPSSQAHITNGESSISGSFTSASSKALADQLKFGALPLTFEVNGVSEEGPTLAGTQLEAGLYAGLAGLVVVVLYCLFYYRGLGLVVVGSLLVAGALTYAMVLLLGRSVGFTLTLPGIAGLIVAIGITADSFIVFFERIRDEVRDGKSLRLAVEAGWTRARSTILAADAVSFLAALILFIFAIGVVRGFAFALGLTTLIDVFVVFFFTKPLVSLLARTKFFGEGHKLSGLDPAHLGISGRKVSQTARSRPEPATSGVAMNREDV